MEIVDIYQASRANLIDLAPTVDPAAPVKATPAWTVKDVYAHLAGVCTDFLAQDLDGAGSPEWTAKQVALRTDRPIEDICAEWVERAEGIDAWLAERGNRASFMGNDVWCHEQDIRATTSGKGVRDARAGALVAVGLDFIDKRMAEGKHPIRVRTQTSDRVLGSAEPRATLHTDDYELLRMIFGRRTEQQIAAAKWEGDAAGAPALLHIFPYPESDLHD